MANIRVQGPIPQDYYCLTTDLVASKPNITLQLSDVGTSCYVIDATTTPHSVSAIFTWYGTDWAEY